MTELGFSPPRPDEEARIVARDARGELPLAIQHDPVLRIPAAVLSANPLISYSGSRSARVPLGLASLAGPALRDRPVWFLLSPTWSLEEDGAAETLRGLAPSCIAARAPSHRLIFVVQHARRRLASCRPTARRHSSSTRRPTRPSGFPAAGRACGRTSTPSTTRELVPWKRHELTLEIPRCAFLFYRDRTQPSAVGDAAAIGPGTPPPRARVHQCHEEDGTPVRLSLRRQRHLNRARVGLCLSAREGAMFASMEYLLSGLPIVTTPSMGGRDSLPRRGVLLDGPADPDPWPRPFRR